MKLQWLGCLLLVGLLAVCQVFLQIQRHHLWQGWPLRAVHKRVNRSTAIASSVFLVKTGLKTYCAKGDHSNVRQTQSI
jgi:hypothetical protein